MATSLEDYGPFDAGIGASRSEDFWRAYFVHLTGSGVIDGELNEFAVAQRAAGANMSVDVATGRTFVRGHWGESTTLKNLAISAAHATLARIDRVILRADFTNNRIELDVLTGTAAASPSAPALTQSTAMWEISLAQIAVAAAAASVVTANITDQRTIIGFPTFDASVAPTNGQAMVYDSTTGLWEPGTSGSSVTNELGYGQTTTPQTAITAEVDLTGLSVAVTADGTNPVWVEASVPLQKMGSANYAGITLHEGATQLSSEVVYMDFTTYAFRRAYIKVRLLPTSGAHTYKARALAGTGGVDTTSSATNPAWILATQVAV